ncbi:MAG TPA: polysaccharide biosynthesis C-terminal domain-containing protein [Candidatus Cloacimonadota bacterium]|nr:polysaccharide biosynthesis C-terminal domain-containing protein [Candidatus Cloacimonadota bacterium]
MSYKANITSNLINQILHLVLGFVGSIFIARVLGPSGQGYVAYITLVFTMIGSYGHLGLNNAVMFFYKRKKIPADHLYYVNTTFLTLIFLVISAIVLTLKQLGLILHEYPLSWVLGGLSIVISSFFYYNNHSWYVANERIRQANRRIIAVFLIKSLVIIILGILNKGYFYWATIGSMILSASLLHLGLKKGLKFRWDFSLIKREYAYGFIIFLAAAFDHLHLRVDQLYIKAMLDNAQLGIYTLSVTLSELMFMVPGSITTALTARLYNPCGERSSEEIMAKTFKLTLYVCIALALIAIPASFAIPLVYGRDFTAAIYSTLILIPGVVFASLARVATPYFFTSGRPQVHLRVALTALVTNCILNYPMIKLWGINGAAIASTISYFVYGCSYIYILIRKEKFKAADLTCLRVSELKELIGRQE